MELSWKLRPASSSLEDKFVDCVSQFASIDPVTRIRLHWRVDGGEEVTKSWPCDDNHGVTGFDLPPGTADLWVSPDCPDGPAAANTYIAPAVLQRTVTVGETISLGAVELVVFTSYCSTDQPCICFNPAPLAPREDALR